MDVWKLTLLLLLGLSILTGASVYSFHQKVHQEIKSFLNQIPSEKNHYIDLADYPQLPEPVRRYFQFVGIEGKPAIRFARLKHEGTFRLQPDQAWFPVEGHEYFTTDQPGLLWYAQLKFMPLFSIWARDLYQNQHGNMWIRPLGEITLANAKGPELDVSSLLRYLSETPWFPTALLPSDYLNWEPLDEHSAKVVINDHGVTASVIFFFDERGAITELVSEDRYRTAGNEQIKTRWGGYYQNYSEMNGIKIPTQIEGIWHLDEGDFSYAKFTLTQIDFNVLERY